MQCQGQKRTSNYRKPIIINFQLLATFHVKTMAVATTEGIARWVRVSVITDEVVHIVN